MNAGTRLGPYEVLAPIGAGGMGEVWRGRDTRLDRGVAIKVLPAEFAQNAQLKQRFEREAKAISQLNHPHICTLYDVGDGYLVMELLEGESLAGRVARGALPMHEVVKYGAQIADALDKAHRAGIVHRDLKPGNIMITKSGAKLLDFGLAKQDATRTTPHSALTQQKPLTQEGTILGTFQYMAPEQLEGDEADARTDIFALGAVLYEMATGRRPFSGKSQASLIASILAAEPQPISAIQRMTPAWLDRVVRKCLEKEPDNRWQSAGDVATALRWTEEMAPAVPQRQRKRAVVAWSIASLAVIGSGVLAALMWRDLQTHRNAPPIRTTILAPEKTAFAFGGSAAPPAISPDGNKIVFGAAESEKGHMLWVRSIDSLVAYPIAGTEQGMYPFWSPDSRTIGFFDAASLKKIDVSGGAAVVVCNVVDGRGGSWSPDGRTILFAGRYTPISRVSASGGTPVEVTKLDEASSTHRWPEFLPDGKHFLFLAAVAGVEDPMNAIAMGSIDGGPWKRLIANANEPHYFGGAIVFTRDGTLTAQRFEMRKPSVVGDAIPLKEQRIASTANFSRSNVSVSANGTLVYQIGAAVGTSQLVSADRTGKEIAIIGDVASYNGVALAPDSQRILTAIHSGAQTNVWMIDMKRNVKTRLTFDRFDNYPIWSPDGTKMLYASASRDAGTTGTLVLHDLTNGSEETLFAVPRGTGPFPTSWSSDGKTILFSINQPKTRTDIYWMSLADRKAHPYAASPFSEGAAQFSPDGKWVAYQSNESGPWQVYIAPFPPTGAKWQVSSITGVVPRWRGDGKELYYAMSTNTQKLVAVPVSLGTTPQIGEAIELFTPRMAVFTVAMYDVTKDGQRFIVNSRYAEDAPIDQIVLMQHFDNELREALRQ